MRKFLVLIPVVALAACASGPKEYKLKGYDGPEAMDNNEVMMMAKQCINNRMRPNVQYAAQKTEFGTVMLPVYVTCEPYLGNK